MTTNETDRQKLELLTKIASLPAEQLRAVMESMDRAGTLVELAKLPPAELSAMLVKLERHKTQQLAKAAKKTTRRSFATWSTPLNPR